MRCSSVLHRRYPARAEASDVKIFPLMSKLPKDSSHAISQVPNSIQTARVKLLSTDHFGSELVGESLRAIKRVIEARMSEVINRGVALGIANSTRKVLIIRADCAAGCAFLSARSEVSVLRPSSVVPLRLFHCQTSHVKWMECETPVGCRVDTGSNWWGANGSHQINIPPHQVTTSATFSV